MECMYVLNGAFTSVCACVCVFIVTAIVSNHANTSITNGRARGGHGKESLSSSVKRYPRSFNMGNSHTRSLIGAGTKPEVKQDIRSEIHA